MKKNELTEAVVGIEPIGHYWFNLGTYLRNEGILLTMVNLPYMPEGVYADLRVVSADRMRIRSVCVSRYRRARDCSPSKV